MTLTLNSSALAQRTKLWAAAIALGLGSSAALAVEGADQYPNGAENWLAGAAPPPGNYFINYAGHYSATKRDGSGNALPVKVSADFDAARFLQVTETRLLGANWGWHVIVPVVHQTVEAPNGKVSTTGLGDITINPLVLGWHTPTWHYGVGLDINVPTGQYDKNDGRRSIGANYISVEPIFAASYLDQNGWDVSGKFMLNFKGKNTDTNYQSGTEFRLDYLAGKNVGPWGVGLSGYYVKQISDDELGGVKVGADGNRGQVLAIGPSVKYTLSPGTLLVAQWQRETHVENRFSGNKVWLKLIMPLP